MRDLLAARRSLLMLLLTMAGCRRASDAGAAIAAPAPVESRGADSGGTTQAAAPAPVDLGGVKPRVFDSALQAELAAYVRELMPRAAVPGAAVAVVQDGEVVYRQGFGVREIGKPEPVTPATLMMIGSTGKAMTTMMMATVVDDRKMRWDTPAVDVLPSFALRNAELTPKVTMRHLVCNCTGVVRRDIPDFFSNRPRSAEGMIAGLGTIPLQGTFGESFQYSNRMVAAGGYLAARAAGGRGDLHQDYLAAMQKRVFDPIGMSSTTFSQDKARESRDRAIAHARTADYGLVPYPLPSFEPLQLIAPAGGSWSNVDDLARYLITQSNRGVAPDGKRVVSQSNLEFTWQPQVKVSPIASYALGWGVLIWHGVRVLTHNGGTTGFTSNLTLLPDVHLGIAVLCNAEVSDPFVNAVWNRVFELVYDQPKEGDAGFVERERRQRAEALSNIAGLQAHVDLGVAKPYLGVYQNDDLGEVRLTIDGDRLILHTTDNQSELRSLPGARYVLWDPPLAGLQIELEPTTPPSFKLISLDAGEPGTFPFRRAR